MSGEEAGMGEGGVGEGFSGCNMLSDFFLFFSFSFILFLSIYISLTTIKEKIKMRVHERLNFFVFS